jgi:diguanylate cyclase (GGDEF)-like protein
MRWRPLLLACCVALSVLAGVVLWSAQRRSETEFRERFADRALLAAQFSETFALDLLAQERRAATRELSNGRVSAAAFQRVVDLFDYKAAILLDARGLVLHVAPANPEIIGENLTAKYPHLRSAIEGKPAVSPVVPSAGDGAPVVAFATRYGHAGNERVFSGAFDVGNTPLGSYLRNSISLEGAHVYVLDPRGGIVASNRDDLRGAGTIAEADRQLAGSLARTASGETADEREFASSPVAGTPWRLVMSVPHSVLFRPLERFSRFVPWLLWFGFALAAFACALLVSNLIASRAKLRYANDDLDRLARTDALTDIPNRREIGEQLDAAVAIATRHQLPLSVLMVDIDHFKTVNDTHGHEVGDDVLRLVAGVLRDSIRLGDRIGRWGGEEFMIVLPSTLAEGAEVAAERVRSAVAASPIVAGGELLQIHVSVGGATYHADAPDTLVARADEAMYAAKAAGRDTVILAY